MATGQVLPPPPMRPITATYTRKRRHSVSAPPPGFQGFQLPFPHAPKPVTPLLTPSAATATTAVSPRRRVSTQPLSPHSRPATLGHVHSHSTGSSRASMQRRLATYGEQGVAAASLASLEASCANGADGNGNVITTKVTLGEERSHLRKKQRPALISPSNSSNIPSNDAASQSSNEGKSGGGLWNVRTFPFHRIRPGVEVPRRRLGIPSFGWPKPAAASQPAMSPDTTMMDVSEDRTHPPPSNPHLDAYNLELAPTTEISTASRSMPIADSINAGGYPIDFDIDAVNSRQGSFRRRSATSTPAPFQLRPIPKPITKFSRKKSPAPATPVPNPLPAPPRYSSPLGPERHILPPRPLFPRSIQSRAPSRSGSTIKLGRDGTRVLSLGEKGSAADMYRRVLLKNTQQAVRKREIAKLEQLTLQAEKERDKGEVYVLRLADDVKGGVGVMVLSEPSKETESPISQAKASEEDEKMEVDEPDFGDIELLPDIPDMDFEDES